MCESVRPRQHECVCFPGYAPTIYSDCELTLEEPPVGQAWQSGPGYEALEQIVRLHRSSSLCILPLILQSSANESSWTVQVRGTFRARIGESPNLLRTSSLSVSTLLNTLHLATHSNSDWIP